MKPAIMLLMGALALSSCTTAMKEGERGATKAEIERIAVGKTVNGEMSYGADGSYKYKGRDPGKYRISDGSICINFNAGGSRCDKIITDGSRYYLVNSGGERFSFG